MIADKEVQIQANVRNRLGSLSVFMIGQVSHLMAKRANRDLAKAGFTLQMEQLPILFTIYFSGSNPLSQQDIANALQKDKSGVQRSLRTLERDGYLRIVADTIDRRRNLINLTPAGKLAVEKIVGYAEKIDSQLTSQLTTEEVSAFLTTMRKISTVLES